MGFGENFNSVTDRRTDGWRDGRTDGLIDRVTYRVAYTRLKKQTADSEGTNSALGVICSKDDVVKTAFYFFIFIPYFFIYISIHLILCTSYLVYILSCVCAVDFHTQYKFFS